MKNNMSAIELHHFSLAYSNPKDREPLQVLNDITLSIQPGEIITIIGPSGCGKTTLLRAVAGLLTNKDDTVICDGSLDVLGMPVSDAKRERTFAFTFQNPILLPWRNVQQNVGLPLELTGGPDREDMHAVDEMLSMVGIGEFAQAMPSEISGGMKQRVNLARALIQEPKVLLMDEPFGSLDEVTRERLNFELLRIHRLRKPTILFVTHSLSEAALLGDRILILSKRPSRIREIIPNILPHERTEETLVSSDYLDLVRRVRRVFSQEDSMV
ncbi:MAG: ABC transporter ATP-binding protein [Candidatus Thiodiazotropha endolucinida]